MASSSSRSSSTTANRSSFSAPVVAEWREADTQHLGCKSPQLVFEAAVDTSRKTASLWLRLLVGLKDNRRKVRLYLIIDPEKVLTVGRHVEDIPQRVCEAMVKGGHCQSAQDLVGIRFAQHPHSALIIAPCDCALSPKTSAAGATLESLLSLASSECFTLYIPTSYIERGSVDGLSQGLGGGAYCLPEGCLERLYAGRGFQIVNRPGSSTLAADSPPSYDELALSSPSRQPTRPSRGEQTNKKRKQPSSDGGELDWQRTLEQGLNALETRLEERWAEQLERRLAETRETILMQIDERVEKRLTEIDEKVMTRLDELEERVEKRLDDITDEAEDRLHVFDEQWQRTLDETLLDIKEGTRQHVAEELANAEETIRDDLRSALS
ncbi:hypothetical protein B0J12DRAFT_687627 [Macrophomina phaseolina]|uniref:Uncharacterized protein n=1 Tax=Macrophomina phaseolina TaxID=35725 RepID=A0ABQ8FS66_9PEZI|nr:hypothetical protein B0J12DRAFT_687627 [Macrophomina phaseolina]